MKSSNLVTLFNSFSKEEFKEFGKFVRSPYFNTHKDVIRYYTILKKYYPSFNLFKEAVFEAVYPGRKFNNGEFLKLNSRFYRLGLEFLKCQPDNFDDEFKLLEIFIDRDQRKQFHSLYKKLNDYIDNEYELDKMIFVKKISLITALIRFHMNKDEQKKVCNSVIKRGNFFAYQSLLWIMIQLRDMTANFNAYNYEFEDSPGYKYIKSIDLEKIITSLEFENNRLGRYLKYYSYCLMIMLHPDNVNYFEQFKKAFQNIFKEVNPLEKNNYLARLQSYVMNHIQSGNLKYIPELLEAYKFFFDLKNVFENNIIPVPPFRNCLALALYAKDTNLLNELAEKYSGRIYPDYREDTRNLARAYLNFVLKKYDAVLECTNKFAFKYPPYKLDIKHLILKVYFESGDYEPFLLLTDSFRHFINNSKSISEKSKAKYYNFITIVNNIFTLKIDNKTNGFKEILIELHGNKNDLFELDRLWLLEMIQKK